MSSSLLAYVGRRVLWTLPTLLLVGLLVFVLMRLIPGDPALLILGVGLVIAVFLQVQIGLRPLYALRNEIADVRKGKAARIARSYPLEIQPLAEQVNRLLDHNQETVERQRTHVGNLAHALKTPLSVMLAEAGDNIEKHAKDECDVDLSA